jgi:hypothetical protein
MKIPTRNRLLVLGQLTDERPTLSFGTAAALVDAAAALLELDGRPSDAALVLGTTVLDPVRALELVEDLLGYERCGACGLRHLPDDCDLVPPDPFVPAATFTVEELTDADKAFNAADPSCELCGGMGCVSQLRHRNGDVTDNTLANLVTERVACVCTVL